MIQPEGNRICKLHSKVWKTRVHPINEPQIHEEQVASILAMEHWTCSIPSWGYWRGHGSLPKQSTYVFCGTGKGLLLCPLVVVGLSGSMGWIALHGPNHRGPTWDVGAVPAHSKTHTNPVSHMGMFTWYVLSEELKLEWVEQKLFL